MVQVQKTNPQDKINFILVAQNNDRVELESNIYGVTLRGQMGTKTVKYTIPDINIVMPFSPQQYDKSNAPKQPRYKIAEAHEFGDLLKFALRLEPRLHVLPLFDDSLGTDYSQVIATDDAGATMLSFPIEQLTLYWDETNNLFVAKQQQQQPNDTLRDLINLAKEHLSAEDYSEKTLELLTTKFSLWSQIRLSAALIGYEPNPSPPPDTSGSLWSELKSEAASFEYEPKPNRVESNSFWSKHLGLYRFVTTNVQFGDVLVIGQDHIPAYLPVKEPVVGIQPTNMVPHILSVKRFI